MLSDFPLQSVIEAIITQAYRDDAFPSLGKLYSIIRAKTRQYGGHGAGDRTDPSPGHVRAVVKSILEGG